MPLYAYRCTKCGYEFEKIQSFSAKPEAVCPQCGGALERPLTAPAFNFKGAGWYVNDYASRPAAGGSNKPAAETAPAADSKSESKPATESKPASSDSTSKPAAPSTSGTA